MARKKGLTDFNLSLIRYLMRQQNKGTKALAQEIDVSDQHLSRVLNRHVPLSEEIGKKIAGVLVGGSQATRGGILRWTYPLVAGCVPPRAGCLGLEERDSVGQTRWGF